MKLFYLFLGTVIAAGPPNDVERYVHTLRKKHPNRDDETIHRMARDHMSASSDGGNLSARETERVILGMIEANPLMSYSRIAQEFSRMHPNVAMNRAKVCRIHQNSRVRAVAGRTDVYEGRERNPWTGLTAAQREVLLKRLNELTMEEVQRSGGGNADAVTVKGRVQAKFFQEFNLYVPSSQMNAVFSNARSMFH